MNNFILKGMKSKAKIPFKTDVAIIVSLLLAYALFATALFYSFSGEKEKQRILLLNQLERISGDIFKKMYNQGGIDEVCESYELIGLGIYDRDGSVIYEKGTALEKVSPPLRDIREHIVMENGNLQIFRRTSGPLDAGHEAWAEEILSSRSEEDTLYYELQERKEWDRQSRPDPYRRLVETLKNKYGPSAEEIVKNFRTDYNFRVPHYMFLEYSIEEHIRQLRLRRTVLFSILLFLFIVSIAAWQIIRNNIRYKKALAEQEEAIKLGEVARTLVHEIKTPLSAIRLQTGILKKVFKDSNLDELTIIEEEAQRLTRLASKIREFLANPKGHPESLDVMDILKALVTRAPGNFELIEPSAERPAFTVFADRDRLISAIENVLRNAAESSKTASSQKAIHVKTVTQKNHGSIIVTDHGPGIPQEIVNQMFEPFFTTKTDGSGIGLTITKRFVEAAGGSVQLLSTGPEGTSMEITLPLEKL